MARGNSQLRSTALVGTGILYKCHIARWRAVCNVSIPTLTVYSLKNKSTDVAVVVFRGGGCNCLGIDAEGVEIMAVGCSGNFPLSTCPGSLIIRA